MSNVKAPQSKRSKRTLNILEQIVRDQVLADEEKRETAKRKTKCVVFSIYIVIFWTYMFMY